MDREQKRDLLKEAIEKQICLTDEREAWDRDIPNCCPPVLWFGDSTTHVPLAVTVAANPSHKEYLNESRSDLGSEVDSNNDHEDLEYLEGTDSRLHLLDAGEIVNLLTTGHFRHDPLRSRKSPQHVVDCR